MSMNKLTLYYIKKCKSIVHRYLMIQNALKGSWTAFVFHFLLFSEVHL